ncbi:MAG: EAL domain-containing protein [Gammaproteobacteria bacterium]|nr:EAL domain-containing protein [Gammaproteobacteria bacterium]
MKLFYHRYSFMRQRLLRNLFFASLFTIAGIAIYLIAILYPSFSHSLIEQSEQNAVRIAKHMGAMLNPGLYQSNPEQTAEEEEEILAHMEDLGLYKLRLFSAEGEILYSSQNDEIGEINHKSYFHQRVAKGEIYSKLVVKGEETAEGVQYQRHVVETYVPNMVEDQFISAVEVYYDITPSYTTLSSQYQQTVIIVLLLTSILLIYLIVVLQRAGNAYLERERGRVEIEQLGQRWKQLLNSVSEGVIGIDLDHRLTFINPAMYHLLQIDPAQDLSHTRFSDLFHHCDHQGRHYLSQEDFFSRTVHNHAPYRSDPGDHLQRQDGTLFPAAISSSPLIDHQNALITGVVATFSDISEQVRDQKQLRLAASVFNSAREGIMITNRLGTIVEVNEAFGTITGYSRSEVIGKTPSILKSGRQSPEFYAEMWETLITTKFWSGEIWNRHKKGHIFAEQLTISAVSDIEGEIQHYVALFSDITQQLTQLEHLENIAHYDNLTGLPNRTLLHDRLSVSIAHSKRSGDLLAVCLLDLDGFKPVNDTYGHEAGDHLLKEVARRLLETIRAEDTALRLGGDEFVLLVGYLKNINECELTLNRILNKIAEPVTIGENSVKVSGSLGVTLFPGDSADPDLLLRHADQAMYVAKESGKGVFHIFDTTLASQKKQNRATIERMTHAIHNGQMELYYQPKVDCSLSTIIGVEALLRWNHPIMGVRLPGEFLPLITQEDLIADLGDWVIDKSLQQLQQWHEMGIKISVSVNVSAIQFLRKDFSSRFDQILARYSPELIRHIEIEILESAALQDLKLAREIIDHYCERGISFALDDFGTGYSSLVHLKHLTINTLKIDRGFVRNMLVNPGDLAITQGVIGLAEAFQYKVVAEGVETIEHILMLMELGSPILQGFAIARPMPGAQLPEWYRNFEPDPRWRVAFGTYPKRADFDLLLMEVFHHHWLEELLHCTNEQISHHDKGCRFDYHNCRLTRWYSEQGLPRYGNISGLSQIGILHREVHDLQLQLKKAQGEGIRQQIIKELEQLNQKLLSHLRQLRLEIAKHEQR